MARGYGYVEYGLYDSNTMTVNDGVTNYDAKTTGGAFTTKTPSTLVSIRTNKTISVRINATTNDAITITATDSPFELVDFLITNLYITNASGEAATIQIFNA